MDRRKELKQQYLQMKPDMGIFIIRSEVDNKAYIEATKNLKSKINASKFKLNAGGHPNRKLQKDWANLGADKFTFEILEHLEYDKDESKTDYSEELAIMQMIWKEKLAKESIELY